MDVLAELEQAPTGAIRSAFIEFVSSRGDDALRKSGGAEHLTASWFVFSPDLRQVLLTHHRKGEFWGQFGAISKQPTPHSPVQPEERVAKSRASATCSCTALEEWTWIVTSYTEGSPV